LFLTNLLGVLQFKNIDGAATTPTITATADAVNNVVRLAVNAANLDRNTIGGSVLSIANGGTGTNSIATTFRIGDGTAGTKSLQFVAGLTAIGTLQQTPTAARAIILPDASGTAVLADSTTGRLTLKSRTVTPAAIAASNINWNDSDIQTITLTANTTFTFSNTADGQTVRVFVTNPGTFVVTWPATVKWKGGTAPVQTTLTKTDIYELVQVGGLVYGKQDANF